MLRLAGKETVDAVGLEGEKIAEAFGGQMGQQGLTQTPPQLLGATGQSALLAEKPEVVFDEGSSRRGRRGVNGENPVLPEVVEEPHQQQAQLPAIGLLGRNLGDECIQPVRQLADIAHPLSPRELPEAEKPTCIRAKRTLAEPLSRQVLEETVDGLAQPATARALGPVRVRIELVEQDNLPFKEVQC